jgi:hypothetical protein
MFTSQKRDHNIAGAMSKRRPLPTHARRFDPVYSVAGVFSAHRDLKPYAKLTLGDSGLSVEEAGILVLLVGLKEFGWDDCPVDAAGFVTFKDLQSVLVHDASLFARRVKKLAAPKCGLLEVRRIEKQANPGVHGNTQQVRITQAGIAAVQPIWEKFRRLSAKLFATEPLRGFSQAELEAHVKVNDAICRAIRDWSDPAKRLL